VARLWAEFVDHDPGKITTLFQEDAPEAPVIVSGTRVHNLCEPYLMPFWADVTIAYIPRGKVIGLSKLARITHQHAHRLQLQERLVLQIIKTVRAIAGTADVMVVTSGEHSCIVARGIKTAGLMTSMDSRGAFLAEPHLRAEMFVQHRRGLRQTAEERTRRAAAQYSG
jgi:GTP cyclohydrolase I